jgi:hypothetical protein
MTTDDRDIESQNPSKSFKVGEVDRLSGFFTPVWESKRRLRADSPLPSSGAAASTPSSARGGRRSGDKAAAPPAALPGSPPQAGAAQPVPGIMAGPVATQPSPAHPLRRASSPPRASTAQRASIAPKPGLARAAPTDAAVTPALATPVVTARSDGPAPPGPLALTPPTPTMREERDQGLAAPAADVAKPATPVAAGSLGAEGPATAAGSPDAEGPAANPPAAAGDAGDAGGDPSAAPVGADPRLLGVLTSAEAVAVRPVIPMPNTPGRPPARPKAASSVPSAASIALIQAGPNLSAEDFLDREPEFRAPPTAAVQQRRAAQLEAHQRASAAATALREKFERKLATDSVETFARHRETESEREALQAAAARAAATPADPYPSHVLRTLRRTIHLSTPLPDGVRQMLERYRS